MTDLWVEATHDFEREDSDRQLVAAREQVVDLWQFLASSVNQDDYENRKALIADRLDNAAQGETRQRLEAALDRDFEVVLSQRPKGRKTAQENEAPWILSYMGEVLDLLDTEADAKAARTELVRRIRAGELPDFLDKDDISGVSDFGITQDVNRIYSSRKTAQEQRKVLKLNKETGEWEPFDPPFGDPRYVPMGWGGHARSERNLDELMRGEEIRTPLGTYKLAQDLSPGEKRVRNMDQDVINVNLKAHQYHQQQGWTWSEAVNQAAWDLLLGKSSEYVAEVRRLVREKTGSRKEAQTFKVQWSDGAPSGDFNSAAAAIQSALDEGDPEAEIIYAHTGESFGKAQDIAADFGVTGSRKTAQEISDPTRSFTLNPETENWIGNFTDEALAEMERFWSSEEGAQTQPYLPGYDQGTLKLIRDEKARRTGSRKTAYYSIEWSGGFGTDSGYSSEAEAVRTAIENGDPEAGIFYNEASGDSYLGKAQALADELDLEEFNFQAHVQGNGSRKTGATVPRIPESKVNKVLDAVKKAYGPWLDEDSKYGPKAMELDGRQVILWEEGPYEWTIEFPYGGIDEEFGFKIPDVSVDMPEGVFAEPVNGFTLALYPDFSATYGSRKMAATCEWCGEGLPEGSEGHWHQGIQWKPKQASRKTGLTPLQSMIPAGYAYDLMNNVYTREIDGINLRVEIWPQRRHTEPDSYFWTVTDRVGDRSASGTTDTLAEAVAAVDASLGTTASRRVQGSGSRGSARRHPFGRKTALAPYPTSTYEGRPLYANPSNAGAPKRKFMLVSDRGDFWIESLSSDDRVKLQAWTAPGDRIVDTTTLEWGTTSYSDWELKHGSKTGLFWDEETGEAYGDQFGISTSQAPRREHDPDDIEFCSRCGDQMWPSNGTPTRWAHVEGDESYDHRAVRYATGSRKTAEAKGYEDLTETEKTLYHKIKEVQGYPWYGTVNSANLKDVAAIHLRNLHSRILNNMSYQTSAGESMRTVYQEGVERDKAAIKEVEDLVAKLGSRKRAATFLVKHDFTKSQPAVNWASSDYGRRYGPQNEGFTIEAADQAEVEQILRSQYNLNPFYVSITRQGSRKTSAFGEGDAAGYSGVAAQAYENGRHDAQSGYPAHPPGDEEARAAYLDGWDSVVKRPQLRPHPEARKTAQDDEMVPYIDLVDAAIEEAWQRGWEAAKAGIPLSSAYEPPWSSDSAEAYYNGYNAGSPILSQGRKQAQAGPPEPWPESACGEQDEDTFCIRDTDHEGDHQFRSRFWIENKMDEAGLTSIEEELPEEGEEQAEEVPENGEAPPEKPAENGEEKKKGEVPPQFKKKTSRPKADLSKVAEEEQRICQDCGYPLNEPTPDANCMKHPPPRTSMLKGAQSEDYERGYLDGQRHRESGGEWWGGHFDYGLADAYHKGHADGWNQRQGRIPDPQDETGDQVTGMRKGAPFADYKDFADCTSKNSDKDDPEAYCGYIKHKVEDSKESKVIISALLPRLTNSDFEAATRELGRERVSG